jgi:hypothetical protein
MAFYLRTIFSGKTWLVATREELEPLPTPELYDRATRWARHHADVKFFWNLLQALPVAESSVSLEEGESDVQSIWSHLNDRRTAREGPVADAMREMYIEYLLKHPKA